MSDDGGGESASLLVVDDNEANRDMLSRRLRRRGYDVVLADDGRQAIDLVAGRMFELILLDVMMPGIDGFEVLETLRRAHPATDLPIVMATARDRSEDVVRALGLGANDYVTKPLDFPVVLARVQTQIALLRSRRALTAAHARMKKDLEAAAVLQLALMPQSLPRIQGVRLAWRFRPCTELAGDILDIVRLDDDLVGLYLLDVSGHGVPAALLSVTLSRVISHMADGSGLLMEAGEGLAGPRAVPPAQVAARLNRRFPMDPETRQYFTFLYGVLDRRALKFRYVSAGHPGPVHLRRGAPPVLLPSTGPAIGWFDDSPFEERSIDIQPGDRIYFHSDGVLEAKNPAQELFEPSRSLQALAEAYETPLEESLDALLRRVGDWCAEAGPDDDISLIGVEIDGVLQPGPSEPDRGGPRPVV